MENKEKQTKSDISFHSSPVAEFSVSVCSTPKFICSSGDGVPRLVITEIEPLIKVIFTKTG